MKSSVAFYPAALKHYTEITARKSLLRASYERSVQALRFQSPEQVLAILSAGDQKINP
jgi:hypothetical protein